MSERAIRRDHARKVERALKRTRQAALLTGAAICAGGAFGSSAQAADYEVTTTADAGAGSLRDAVSQATATTDADTITFASSLSGDIALTSGQIMINVSPAAGGDLSIVGPGAGTLAVSGNDASRIFSANGAGGQFAVSDLTLKDGYAAPVTSGPKYLGTPGGAIEADSGVDLTISATTLKANEASKYGGAVAVIGGSAALDNVTIANNEASKYGGGIAILGNGTSATTSSTISGSTISGNTVSGEVGDPSGAGKYASAGAGGIGANGAITIERSSISDNVVNEVSGSLSRGAGGIESTGAVKIVSSTISGNRGGIGGIRATDNDTAQPIDPAMGLLLSNSTVSGNAALGSVPPSSTTSGQGYGGGLLLRGEVGGTIQNSTIAGNRAEQGGGGVFSYAGAESTSSGSYFTPQDRSISSTIVAGNTAAGSPNDLGTGGVGAPAVGFSAGFSLIETPGSASLDANPPGSNILGTDPKLGPLADNGGPTKTLLPASRSAVVDKGTANGLTVDQRGLPRTENRPPANAADGTDIGSVELPADTTPPTTTITSGPANGSKILTDTASFAFSADEESTFECRLDGGAWSSCTSPQTLNGLSNDTHTFEVRATDESGNVGNTASRTFKTILAFCNGTPATIVAEEGEPTEGTDGPDVIVGSDGPDLIKAFGGDDQICALGGDDEVDAGPGNDAVTGEGGDDTIRGRGGADELFGDTGADLLIGGGGDDMLQGANGTDELRGGGGDDELEGRQGEDKLEGNQGDDLLGGGPNADLILGGSGDDLVKGAKGPDELRGAAGNDEIRGAKGADDLFGGEGDDFLNGGQGNNTCVGGTGENELRNCSGG